MPKSQKGSSRDLLDKVKKVSAAGRGGDTKLAHLSPMAQKILKGAGGAGTRNPKTGLKEFKAASVFARRAAAEREQESEARRALAEFEAARNQAMAQMAQMAPPAAEPGMERAAVQPEAEPIAPPPAFTPPVEAAPPPRTAREEFEAITQPQAAAPPPAVEPPLAAAPGSAAADLQQITNPTAPPPAAAAPPPATGSAAVDMAELDRIAQGFRDAGMGNTGVDVSGLAPGSLTTPTGQVNAQFFDPNLDMSGVPNVDPATLSEAQKAMDIMRQGGTAPGINMNIPGVTGGAVTQPPAAAAPPPGSAAADMSELEKARLAAAEERRNQREDVRDREDLWNPPGAGTRPQPGDRPGLGNPPITEPPVTEPPVTEPPVTEPPVTQPPPSQPPPSQPPPSQPPPSQPPPSQPPITQPPGPITQPPPSQPPPSQPPPSQPPPSQPPPSQPPPTQPPPSGPPVAIPPGLIDSPLPKPPAQPPAQPPGTGGIQPLPPGTLPPTKPPVTAPPPTEPPGIVAPPTGGGKPPTGGGKPAPQPPAPPVPPEVIPPGADRPIRTMDFIDRNKNGIDDRDEPPPGDGGKARTGDFQDRNKNGIDDRDEGPSGGGRGLFNFGNFFGEDTDIGRLIGRIGRGGGSRGGGKKPPPGGGKIPELPPTGGGLPARPELPPIVGTPQPPGGGATPPVGGYPPYTPQPPIRMPNVPLPPPLPTPIGAGTPTPYFNPNAGGLTPGTVPAGNMPTSLATSNVPLQALGQNPNLGPSILGGAENTGYYTDRFGNMILSPGAVKPGGRKKGGPSNEAELLRLMQEFGGGDKDELKGLKQLDSARAMLDELSSMQPETEVSYEQTPVSQSVRRTSRAPIRRDTERGSARGMAMELEEVTKAQGPRTKAQIEDFRQRMELLRNTLGMPTLTKASLAREGDLMAKRFNEGGEAKSSAREKLDELVEYAGRGSRKLKRGAAELLGVADIPGRAERESVAAFGVKESGGGKADAMRHLMYQADLTRKFNPTAANMISRLYELTSPGQSSAEYEMDLYNDALGREIGQRAKDEQDVVRLAREYVEKNKAKVLPKEERTGYAKGGAVKRKKR